MKNIIIKICIISSFAITLISGNSYAVDTSGNSEASATLSPSCRVKVDNMNFGDITIATFAGNGDVFATTEISLICTKDQLVALTGASSGSGTSWTQDVNYSCQYNAGAGVWINASDTIAPSNGAWTAQQQANTTNQACLTKLANDPANFGSTSWVDFNGYFQTTNTYTYRAIRTDGALIASGEAFDAGIYGGTKMSSGSNKIAYVLSTNTSTYEPIGSVSGSNTLTYDQNNGDWQNYSLYGKANVTASPPGIYTDNATLTINF